MLCNAYANHDLKLSRQGNARALNSCAAESVKSVSWRVIRLSSVREAATVLGESRQPSSCVLSCSKHRLGRPLQFYCARGILFDGYIGCVTCVCASEIGKARERERERDSNRSFAACRIIRAFGRSKYNGRARTNILYFLILALCL